MKVKAIIKKLREHNISSYPSDSDETGVIAEASPDEVLRILGNAYDKEELIVNAYTFGGTFIPKK